MCPMASLFNLIEDPCKSMWNCSVKLDLFSFASAPKVPKMSQVKPTRVTITYPANEEHWDRDLPVEHGQ